MTLYISDCPRCGVRKITFNLMSYNVVEKLQNWQFKYEIFCRCRECKKSTIFVVLDKNSQSSLLIEQKGLTNIEGTVNQYLVELSYVSPKDNITITPPEFIPDKIEEVFIEGATCLSVDCHNAAGTMFRLCIDLVTRELLPQEDVDGLNQRIRRSLGLRLQWLFNNSRLPEALRDLSTCVREDGNDGAHTGTLTDEDAADLLDFTILLLERIYTEPERLRLAKERREQRRANNDQS